MEGADPRLNEANRGMDEVPLNKCFEGRGSHSQTGKQVERWADAASGRDLCTLAPVHAWAVVASVRRTVERAGRLRVFPAA